MIKSYRVAKKMNGFTLIEVMVVVVILGILAAVVVPKIMSRPEQARIVKVKQDIMAIQSALDLYKLDNGIYPTTDQGLQALVTMGKSLSSTIITLCRLSSSGQEERISIDTPWMFQVSSPLWKRKTTSIIG